MKALSIFSPLKTSACLPSVFALIFTVGTISPIMADDMYMWVKEVDGNVVFYHEGSIDLTGFPGSDSAFGDASIQPNIGFWFSGGNVDSYDGTVPTGSTRTFGAGDAASAYSSAGDRFGLGFLQRIMLPMNYISQAPINGSMTFLSTTLAALGVNTTPLTFDTTVGTNTIHMFTLTPERAAAEAVAAAAKSRLSRKIKKLKTKILKLKRKRKKSKARKAKKALKELKELKAQLSALG